MKEHIQSLNQMEWTEGSQDLRCFADIGVAYGFTTEREKIPSPFSFSLQVHGTDILDCTKEVRKDQSADALFGRTAGVLAVKTADCLPLLFADSRGDGTMAVHAGWRGLVGGIVSKSILHFSDRGSDPSDLRVALGPAIGPCCFEVGPEVVSAFLADFSAPPSGFCLTKGRQDRWHLDLATAAAFQCMSLGIPPNQISVVRQCTYETASLPSYRRDGQGAGRLWSWIGGCATK